MPIERMTCLPEDKQRLVDTRHALEILGTVTQTATAAALQSEITRRNMQHRVKNDGILGTVSRQLPARRSVHTRQSY
eukprot:9367678-Pyramimonas_sp.AAC.1